MKTTKITNILIIFYLSICIILLGFGYIAYKEYLQSRKTIYYISKNEILNLEKRRIKGHPKEQIFFGRIEEAFDVIESEAEMLENAGNMVVFSDGSVTGKYTKSVSKKIYQKIIEKLSVK